MLDTYSEWHLNPIHQTLSAANEFCLLLSELYGVAWVHNIVFWYMRWITTEVSLDDLEHSVNVHTNAFADGAVSLKDSGSLAHVLSKAPRDDVYPLLP